ncbi:MAG: FliI/YscN family ATPase [Candidatus Carbobacillus altaicus]|nr:FliI/YscN family ATPase [Candidatus Carbobacillus altaicus]
MQVSAIPNLTSEPVEQNAVKQHNQQHRTRQPDTHGILSRRFYHLREHLQTIQAYELIGEVKEVIGLTVAARGPMVKIGDILVIEPHDGGEAVLCEAVGFREKDVLLMPLGELGSIGVGARVRALGAPLSVTVGPELIGRILDGLGRPMDGKGPLVGVASPIVRPSPSPLSRPPIQEKLSVGVRAIDGLITLGKGQRIGIFAGSGVGKSTLLGMMARGTQADVNVIALIGERGREVREFIERDLGEEGLRRSVVVAVPSDQPALLRIKGALVATAIAEFFRDQGQDVLFMMDSVTRLAMAQREIGLAIGEPPTTRGYPPSVFALLPKVLERTGTSEQGTITAIYTVLVDGDDMNEPIADAVRGILDGHIVLSRKLAHQGMFPAVDILSSVSRLMPRLVDERQRQLVETFRSWTALIREAEDLLSIGAYRRGHNLRLDEALSHREAMEAFLKQRMDESETMENTWIALERAVGPSA